jgi:hypothetical protein
MSGAGFERETFGLGILGLSRLAGTFARWTVERSDGHGIRGYTVHPDL